MNLLWNDENETYTKERRSPDPASFANVNQHAGSETGAPRTRQRLGVRQPPAAFQPMACDAKAAEGCRTPKPRGRSHPAFPMNHQICTGPLPATGLSRRGFLNRFGLGMGGIALANMMQPVSYTHLRAHETRH